MPGIHLLDTLSSPALPGVLPLRGAVDGVAFADDFDTTHAAVAADPAILSSHFLLTRAVPVPLTDPVAPPARFFAAMPMWGQSEAVCAALRADPSVVCLVQCAGMFGLWGITTGEVPAVAGVRRMVVAALKEALAPRPLPVAPPGVIDGDRYHRMSHRKEKRLAAGGREHFTEAMIRDYAARSMDLARRLIAVEDAEGPVSVIFAPVRGAAPMVDAMLEGYRRLRPERPPWEPHVALPPTSSFLTGVHGQGHNGIKLAMERLWQRGLLPGRLGYIDEIVSGGMYRRHLKDIAAVRHERDIADATPVHGFALADRGGSRFRAPKRFERDALDAGRLASFDCVPVIELITEDRRQLLGVHYTDYTLGLHTVPYLDEDGTEPAVFVEMWQLFAETLDAG